MSIDQTEVGMHTVNYHGHGVLVCNCGANFSDDPYGSGEYPARDCIQKYAEHIGLKVKTKPTPDLTATIRLILDHLHTHRPTHTFNSPDYTGGYQHAIDVIRRIRHGDQTGDTT